MLVYVAHETACSHSRKDSNTFMDDRGIRSLPWSVISAQYFGTAELLGEPGVGERT